MTRNNQNISKETPPTPLPLPTEDNITNLPDLSNYRDDEKQHILNVLVRDEDLRNKHLLRFMNLRKEVADLEEQSQATSPSICARCQTSFGYIFNTGDTCPKCGAKVCKQCRLMHDGNDNGWICQLCYKQMQLMSYSGEWIYSARTNLRKDSKPLSEDHHESPTLPATTQNQTVISSSDSEQEISVPSSNKDIRFSTIEKSAKVKKKLTEKDKINRMIVQSTIDEKKLRTIKEIKKGRHPLNSTVSPHHSKQRQQSASTSHAINSSTEDVNSVFSGSNSRHDLTRNQQNSQISESVQNLTKIQDIRSKPSEVDCHSVTSYEIGNRDEHTLENNKLKMEKQKSSASPTRDSNLSLTSTSAKKSSDKHFRISKQDLRDVVHRISHPHLSSSRKSLTSENKYTSQKSNTSTIIDDTNRNLSQVKSILT